MNKYIANLARTELQVAKFDGINNGRETKMGWKSKWLVTFLVSFLLGTLYTALIGLVSHPLRAPLIAWPILTALLWYAFWRFNLLRLSGYLAILPVSILAFEIVRSIIHPTAYAHRYLSLDRSHYTPGTRVVASQKDLAPEEDDYGWELKETLIGKDGFHADPSTGQGNPDRCGLVLIGDSMIYGSGLPYSDTLRPVLAATRADACVFGVTGNAPIDYLSTLKYVANRIEKGAHIAIYIYAYNDFVNLNKYMRRRLLGSSHSFEPLAQLIAYADDWRRTTFTYGLSGRKSVVSISQLPRWQIKLGETKTLDFHSRHDPARYTPPPPLNKGELGSLKLFFRELNNFVRNQPWHVSIVILPDNDEVMANLARQSATFQDLDPRRKDALAICRTSLFGCEDLTSYLYQRVLAEGRNPYLINDRHFSAFGNQIVAEHFLAITKRALVRPIPDYTQNPSKDAVKEIED